MPRLPAPARRALHHLTHTHTHGTDTQYDNALTALAAVRDTLSPAEQTELDARLARTAARVADTQYLAAVRDTLANGHLVSRTVLPGDVELVTYTGALEQVAIALPMPLDTDSAAARNAVDTARTAAMTGTCPRCKRQLRANSMEQLQLPHASRCPAHPARLAALRAA